jgi:hypothetical protein
MGRYKLSAAGNVWKYPLLPAKLSDNTSNRVRVRKEIL